MSKLPDEPLQPNEHRAFFGRRAGKRLHKGQQELMQTLLPALEISAGDDPGALAPRTPFADPRAPTILEIGYGGGEHLARLASENPGTNFVGAEAFTGGIGKMLEKIDDRDIENVRLYTQDAVGLLRGLPDNALAGAYLLYPDPWPKKRHHKRRFVSPLTLDELTRTIRPGGFFRFATDIEDYANWTLAHIVRHPGFVWPHVAPLGWHVPFEGWQPTRYEEKARRQGRMKSWYLTFMRVSPAV
ncbi:MAG: tRNA (guanosine(46)-N7)-methyltransferase TrmB [Hyphomicrobiaceae bacterium]|nr:tRNA (guanosine(46)-N7)-methyltransferase TrmB [Hyphomicrobiaceae bacterium]MCC0025016.1 tRNA (guanosine(46)-N7)-methyltransferase TrmB [Hyphomicrobiaceae bacterium]